MYYNNNVNFPKRDEPSIIYHAREKGRTSQQLKLEAFCFNFFSPLQLKLWTRTMFLFIISRCDFSFNDMKTGCYYLWNRLDVRGATIAVMENVSGCGKLLYPKFKN